VVLSIKNTTLERKTLQRAIENNTHPRHRSDELQTCINSMQEGRQQRIDVARNYLKRINTRVQCTQSGE
jgi:hypothetical protein